VSVHEGASRVYQREIQCVDVQLIAYGYLDVCVLEGVCISGRVCVCQCMRVCHVCIRGCIQCVDVQSIAYGYLDVCVLEGVGILRRVCVSVHEGMSDMYERVYMVC